MAAPAVMSHQAAAHHAAERRSSPRASIDFESDNELDLQLSNFPMPTRGRLASMSSGEASDKLPRAREIEVPTHPIPSMQAAFAESMLDAFEGNTAEKEEYGDSASRRKLLLEQEKGEETHAGRWKQKPGQRYHELWKLMSQLSFGIYLLLNGMARDNDQALNILQGHVDEVDAFLESTLEDFGLAQEDIDDRLKNLKLPLENIHIFDGMLEDRNFRNQIVAGNETIEHIIERTAKMMNDALRNVQHGMEATKEFANYMADMEDKDDWKDQRPDMLKVFLAMKGNADGWCKAYVLLQTKGNQLGTSLVQLGTITAEIDRRAAEISRKTRVSVLGSD